MSKEEWVIKVSDEVALMADARAEEERHWNKRSIYKVPAYVTDLNQKAYKPQAVSFGPYHHGEENLAAMEEHKRRALLHFLRRTTKPLGAYVESLAEVVEDLKDAYDSLGPAWREDTDRFLKLMMLDGCFMLEVLRTASAQGSDDDYAGNDPIFSAHGRLHIMAFVKRDMLMLENQLPMLVLNKLVGVGNENASTGEGEDPVKQLILNFFWPTTKFPTDSIPGQCLHLLDMYRKVLIRESSKKKKPRRRRKPGGGSGDRDGSDAIVRSAMELNEAGIRFKKSKTLSLKDISFKGGVLRLPLILVDDATESTFLNLIAFERFHVGAGNDVTSYVCFIDNIIDSSKDVSLLHSRGIIQNAIGSDKAVAKLFNSLSKDITVDPDSTLDVVHKKVNMYCKKKCNEWRANLMHTYFRSPWAVLSVIAAVFLFALTIAQTVYAVYPYYHPRNSETPAPPPPPPPPPPSPPPNVSHHRSPFSH